MLESGIYLMAHPQARGEMGKTPILEELDLGKSLRNKERVVSLPMVELTVPFGTQSILRNT